MPVITADYVLNRAFCAFKRKESWVKITVAGCFKMYQNMISKPAQNSFPATKLLNNRQEDQEACNF